MLCWPAEQALHLPGSAGLPAYQATSGVALLQARPPDGVAREADGSFGGAARRTQINPLDGGVGNADLHILHTSNSVVGSGGQW